MATDYVTDLADVPDLTDLADVTDLTDVGLSYLGVSISIIIAYEDLLQVAPK